MEDESTIHQPKGMVYDMPPVYSDNIPPDMDSTAYNKFMHPDFINIEMRGQDPPEVSLDGSGSEQDPSVIGKCQALTESFFKKNITSIARYIAGLVLVLYTIFFAFAVSYSVDKATALIVLTCITLFFVIYYFVKRHWGTQINKYCLTPIGNFLEKIWPVLKWIVIPVAVIVLICYLTLVLLTEVQQLQSVVGMVVFIAYLVFTSKHPSKINLRPVVWGLTLQFLFGILVLRWKPGYDAIFWLADQVINFINYSLEGAAYVFGNPTLLLHPLVFVGMPMLIYVGAVMAILYYTGITQSVAASIGWAMQVTMGTTAIESLSVGAGIFLNGLDSMLMIKNYIPRLTKSEFHCFLIGNHATVAGFAFPLFVLFGAPPQYLLSASVMSAPATIAVAKLNYPETEESKTNTSKDLRLEENEDTNLIEAASQGAAMAGKTVGAFVANYIAFVGLLAFFNAFLSWLGGMVGYPELSIQVICGYLFFPVSMLLGVELAECREVGKLIGIKVFVSEILAYQALGETIANNGLSDRAASIATYALCGFCSLSTVSVAVGVWNAVCPERAGLMASQLLRVAINANISCFLTACVAGLMHDPSMNIPLGTDSWIPKAMSLLPDYKDIMALVPGFG